MIRGGRTCALAAHVLVSACAWCSVFETTACTTYENAPDVALAIPSSEGFPPVDAILEPHCGTLDCHGNPARNFRVYGVYGLRVNGSDVTGSPDTTEAEIAATYESIAAVDPESLSAIFHDRARNPERWLVVRKARGVEAHKGGAPLPKGSAGDRCLLSWIAGSTAESDCSSDVFGPVPRDGGK